MQRLVRAASYRAAAVSRLASVASAATASASLPALRRAFGGDSAAKATPASTNSDDPSLGRVIVVTSGKGGVGKTTTAASFSMGLAQRGNRVCAIDFDIGLRNLDLHLGMERRVVFDFVNVLQGEARLHQALIKDRRCPDLFLLAASQTRDKSVLTEEAVENVLGDLRRQFDYIILDSPAGIESGAHHAMYFADEAIICTNPELSSVRDSDKMLGLIASKSKRAVLNMPAVKCFLLVTRYQPTRVADAAMLSVNDIQELLNIPMLGVIPESPDVLQATNLGQPVIINSASDASVAYQDTVARYCGEERDVKFLTAKPQGFFSRVFG